MSLHVVVEGDTDEWVARKIALLAGWDSEPLCIENTRGKPRLDEELPRYNQAARWSPRFVLRDLDTDKPCAGELRELLLPTPERFMCFRLVVRSVEAWLMADPEMLARYLHISPSKIPLSPDAVVVPKDELVNLARFSPKPNIRKDMIPEPGKSRRIGSAYAARINDFSANHWRPEIARENSPSLRRAIVALERLRAAWPAP